MKPTDVVRELRISLQHDGQVVVTGPLEDKLLCYGLLCVAQEQVAKFVPKLIQPVGQIPAGVPVPVLVGKVGGG